MLIACDHAGKVVKNKTGATRCALFQGGKSLVWVLVLGCLAGRAQAEVVEIVAGQPGIVGQTRIFTADVSNGPLSPGDQMLTSIAGMVILAPTYQTFCQTTTSTVFAKGYSGVYGFKIGDTGAVLLPHGTGKWQRTTKAGVVVNGTVSYQMGRWFNTWSPAVTINGSAGTQSRSDTDGLSGISHLFCPQLHMLPSSSSRYERPWSTTANRTASISTRFLVDAPAGGLEPGSYSVSIGLFEASLSGASVNSVLFKETLEIKAADYSCAITAPVSVDLTTDMPTALVKLTVTCSKYNAEASNGKSVYVYTQAAGFSAALFDPANPKLLPVAGSNGAYIVGDWSAMPVWCDPPPKNAPVYFDGTNGPKVFDAVTTKEVTNSLTGYFRLCPMLPRFEQAGQYTAQATFSIVQR